MGRKKGKSRNIYDKMLDKLNYCKRIKIRIRPLASGGYSVFLAISINRKWKYEFLKHMRLIANTEHLEQDKNTILLAAAIRDKRELELLQDGEVHLYAWKAKQSFIEYFDAITKTKAHPCNWTNTHNMLMAYTGGSLTFGQIDYSFCRSFVDFMLTKVSPNTAHVYYGTFKAALNQAVLEGIIQSNPGNAIKIKRQQLETNYLTLRELKILRESLCNHPVIKTAFIFSCFTGLRYSDIVTLEWKDIEDGALIKRQEKTKTFVRVKLAETALEILEEQKILAEEYPHDKIFELPVNHYTNEMLRLWINMCGINKKITFHCARHTFATMCLTHGIDIYTVSKLIGHHDVANTQRYAKLTDQKRDQEIDKLPKL
ncbi:MAG: site-specific integrase [Candidatus Cloacimonetes bacterium]|nr:site-specific integrase [Candidatus Cloacimonadota bacterium]MDY0366696.1 site-specific integrase [Candidatus Syntrophosphaera sp.]